MAKIVFEKTCSLDLFQTSPAPPPYPGAWLCTCIHKIWLKNFLFKKISEIKLTNIVCLPDVYHNFTPGFRNLLTGLSDFKLVWAFGEFAAVMKSIHSLFVCLTWEERAQMSSRRVFWSITNQTIGSSPFYTPSQPIQLHSHSSVTIITNKTIDFFALFLPPPPDFHFHILVLQLYSPIKQC